jgi:hypothetical protein
VQPVRAARCSVSPKFELQQLVQLEQQLLEFEQQLFEPEQQLFEPEQQLFKLEWPFEFEQ